MACYLAFLVPLFLGEILSWFRYKGSLRRDLVKAPVRDPLGVQGFRFQVSVSGQETSWKGHHVLVALRMLRDGSCEESKGVYRLRNGVFISVLTCDFAC